MTVGWLPREAAEIFGEGTEAHEAYDVLTVDVPPGDAWPAALETARSELGCDFFDWLSAVDEPGEGLLRVCAHVVALGTPPRRLLLRTAVPHEAPSLPTATGVYAGAAWHERETHEMFGIDFPGHPGLGKLLLPESFEGHPLRKDFVLAARVAKQWPGAKEPGGETPRRRQPLPPGVPDPNEWGPLRGRASGGAGDDRPARPRRGAGASGGAGGERPVRPRRSRSVSEGSASQRAAGASGGSADSPQGGGGSGAGAAVPNAAPDGPSARAASPKGNGEADGSGKPPRQGDSRQGGR
ncbi:NADH-quinone oxidoreductase subunit C [Streptomyces triticirhizae]|uniref:NADH-quinone oxidoreductase subunit C n=1 Tax=Streptomyces triticirhizae TaxID=2483353 RepID=A0A3M2LKN4_9ACTN|nr:NADH-quinone oxidoreductase subunit C [Streptomyces triticirhizae]